MTSSATEGCLVKVAAKKAHPIFYLSMGLPSCLAAASPIFVEYYSSSCEVTDAPSDLFKSY